MFADDTNLFYKRTDKHFLEEQINKELKQVSMWLKVNKLSLNVSKTHYIIFTRRRKTGNALNIRIENQIIHDVYKTKFLGVIIDKKTDMERSIIIYIQ